jgi:hypothetical protein
MFEEYNEYHISCINGNIEQVKSAIDKILKIADHEHTWHIEYKTFACIKEVCFPMPLKGHNFNRKFLIWSPSSNSNTTIFFSNLGDGWHSLIHILSTKYLFPSYTIALENILSEEPHFLFYYQEDKKKRIVRAMKESNRWNFYEDGTPLVFENLDNYTKKRIKDRVTKQILLDYLKCLNWDILDDAFLNSSKAILYIENRIT